MPRTQIIFQHSGHNPFPTYLKEVHPWKVWTDARKEAKLFTPAQASKIVRQLNKDAASSSLSYGFTTI